MRAASAPLPDSTEASGDLTAMLRAAANSDRLAILEAILTRESDGRLGMTISEIARATELDRFAASRHLAILTAAGLLERATDGPRTRHQLRQSGFQRLEDWLLAYADARPGIDTSQAALAWTGAGEETWKG